MLPTNRHCAGVQSNELTKVTVQARNRQKERVVSEKD
jgi:hypothetical protein